MSGTPSAMSTQPAGVGLRRRRQVSGRRRAQHAARARGPDARPAGARALAVEHRLGGDVEGAAGVADDGAPIRVGDVVGVDGLEAQPRMARDDRDPLRVHQPAGQEGSREQPPDPRRGAALEDQAGAQAHDADVGCSRSKASSSLSTSALWRE